VLVGAGVLLAVALGMAARRALGRK
jgi:hypothetical protein